MSFTRVKIVKKFTIKKNITFNISSKNNSLKARLQLKKNEDYTNHELDMSISDTHYIGLIFCNTCCINIENITDSKKKIFLNKTQIYCMNNNLPLIKIPENDFNENFKFKKYIREKLNSDYCIKNRYITLIKLFETYGNYHIYIVMLKNTMCLSNGISSLNEKSTKFSWNAILDFYYKDITNKNPKQKDIIVQIYNNYNDNSKIYQNKSKDLPIYIKNYKVYYKKILEILSKLDTM